jgi:hypothetical protein
VDARRARRRGRRHSRRRRHRLRRVRTKDDALTALTTPRPAPPRGLPLVAALGALALALPLFLFAGWPFTAWAVGAILYAGLRGLGLVFDQVSSVAGRFWMVARVMAVMAVFIALLSTDVERALAAALVYAAAYSLELAVSLLLYFGQEPVK